MEAAPDPWTDLVADLEAQLDAAGTAELLAEADERVRSERLGASWLDRLHAVRGARLSLGVLGAGTVEGTLKDCGPDWALMAQDTRETVVALSAVCWVRGLTTSTAPEVLRDRVARRWRLSLLLGRLSRRRTPLQLVLADGTRVSGTLAAVGADYVEISEHPPGERPRAAAVTGRRVVAVSALAAVVLAGRS